MVLLWVWKYVKIIRLSLWCSSRLPWSLACNACLLYIHVYPCIGAPYVHSSKYRPKNGKKSGNGASLKMPRRTCAKKVWHDMASHVGQDLSVKLFKGIQPVCLRYQPICFALNTCSTLQKSNEELDQPQWPKLNSIHPSVSTHLHTDGAPGVLPATPLPHGIPWLRQDGPGQFYGGVIGGSMDCIRWLIQQYLQRVKTILYENIYTLLSRLCIKYLQICLEIRRQQKQHSAQKFACILSFQFLSGSICQTIPPTAVYPIPLYVRPICPYYPIPRILSIQFLPLMENIVQLLGCGWCALFGIATVPAVARCCPSALSILWTLLYSSTPILFYPTDLPFTGWCSYNIINVYVPNTNKEHILLTPCLLRSLPDTSFLSSGSIDLFINFSLQDAVHLYHLGSHLTRKRRVDLATVPDSPCLRTTKQYIHLILTSQSWNKNAS